MTIKEEIIQYATDCVSGKIHSGKKHKQACLRFLEDIKKEGNNFWVWNEEEARKIVMWFTYLRHSKGVLASEPIHLTAWQKFIACQIYAWQDTNGNRRFKKVFIEVGRKNAKSQIVSGILLYEISYISNKYGEMMETYCAGVKKDQSKIIFNECDLMLRGSQLRPKFNITKAIIEHRKTGSFIKPLSKEEGRKGDGTNPNTTCLDEYHLHPDTGFYDMHDTGAKARTNSLLFTITTAGFDLNCPCYTQEYKYCSHILDQSVDVDNDRYLIDILEMDKGDELTLENILKANPILSTYDVGINGILESMKEAKEIPEKMTAFLTKTCNVWLQAKEHSYMDMDKFKKCEVKKINWDLLRGKEVYVGFDMSAKIDLTSLAFVVPIMFDSVAKYYVFVHSFIPSREKLMERVRVDKIPYDTWEREGYITITETPIVDQERVIDYMKGFIADKGLVVKMLCFDPANASKLMMDLSTQAYDCFEVFQTHKSLNESTVGFREQVFCENIIYEYNPVLNYSMNNTVVKQVNGLIKIDKDVANKRIDPVDAILCAFKLAMYHEFAFDINDYVSDDYLDKLYGG